jgi:hypothetical protein
MERNNGYYYCHWHASCRKSKSTRCPRIASQWHSYTTTTTTIIIITTTTITIIIIIMLSHIQNVNYQYAFEDQKIFSCMSQHIALHLGWFITN